MSRGGGGGGGCVVTQGTQCTAKVWQRCCFVGTWQVTFVPLAPCVFDGVVATTHNCLDVVSGVSAYRPSAATTAVCRRQNRLTAMSKRSATPEQLPTPEPRQNGRVLLMIGSGVVQREKGGSDCHTTTRLASCTHWVYPGCSRYGDLPRLYHSSPSRSIVVRGSWVVDGWNVLFAATFLTVQSADRWCGRDAGCIAMRLEGQNGRRT